MPDLLPRLFRRRRDHGLTCRELVELVTDYLEDALPSAERARFESHLGACEDCATYVRQMRETLVVLGQLPGETVSARAEAQLRATFREWKAGSAPHS